MIHNLALAIAGIAVSLASLCLAILAVSIPAQNTLLSIPEPIRIVLSGTGFLLIVAAAFTIDWVVDSFNNGDWDTLDEIELDLNEKKLNRRWKFILARTKLFSGGYFLLSLAMAALAFVMLWILTFPITSSDKALTWLSICTAVASAILLFLKMMTRRFAKVTWSLIFIITLLAVSLVLNVVQYYH